MELLECSICKEVFRNPVLLPCIHTFCYKCLENVLHNNQQRNEIVCPLCRRICNLSIGGLKGLQRNLFVAKVKDILLISKSGCEICEVDLVCCESGTSSCIKQHDLVYCIECRQRICRTCCEENHNKFRILRDHQLVDLTNQENFNEVSRKLDQNQCSNHEGESIKMFCTDCQSAICLICFAESHSFHKCSDVNNICKEFREKLQDKIDTIIRYRDTCLEMCEAVEVGSCHFDSEVTSCESAISKTTETIKLLIDKHAWELFRVLSELKTTEREQVERSRSEADHHLVILNSYIRYAKEVINKGSNKDICRSVEELCSRADELTQTYESLWKELPDNIVGVTFVQSDFLHQTDTEHFIG